MVEALAPKEFKPRGAGISFMPAPFLAASYLLHCIEKIGNNIWLIQAVTGPFWLALGS